MEILLQINVAPRIYALTVREVVRRRELTLQFSKVSILKTFTMYKYISIDGGAEGVDEMLVFVMHGSKS